MVAIEFNDVNYILLCVYGYNQKTQNKKLFSSLSRLIEEWKVTYTTDKIIMGGDFNLAPDLWLNRLPSRRQCHFYEEILVEFISQLSLTDYWYTVHLV